MKMMQRRQRIKRKPPTPILHFSPYAWAKLLFLRDQGETEVGGFGLSSAVDPFCVEDLRLVRQRCTSVTVQFDDLSVADFFDEQVDHGRKPSDCGRIWIHTHPGQSAAPSSTDEETFARCFGCVDWAVMFILAKGGETYARLRFNVGPGGELEIPVETDFRIPFPGSDDVAWEVEYHDCVEAESGLCLPQMERLCGLAGADHAFAWDDPTEFSFLEQERHSDEFRW